LPGFIRANTQECKKLLCGVYWLVPAALFITASMVFLFDMRNWPYLAGVGVVASQYAIIRNWSRTKSGTAVNALILFFIILVACGEQSFLKHYETGTISDNPL